MKKDNKMKIENIKDRIEWLQNNSMNWQKSLQHPVEATRFQAQLCIDRNTNEINSLQEKMSSLISRIT
tara:strand:+ start:634 stop:837 length:204 start_codon:yes stop_codon:yes gene_type:complete